MSYRACDMGHVHETGTEWECPTCGGRLFESDAITALCRKLANAPESGVYKIVECVFEDDRVLDVSDRSVRVQGPIGKVLVVTVSNEWMQSLRLADYMAEFMEQTRKVLRDGGWKGEVILVSDQVKLARFAPVEES